MRAARASSRVRSFELSSLESVGFRLDAGGGPPEERGEGGVVQGEADGVAALGEMGGVVFELGGVEAFLLGEEGFEAFGGVGAGFVVDDPEVGLAGG